LPETAPVGPLLQEGHEACADTEVGDWCYSQASCWTANQYFLCRHVCAEGRRTAFEVDGKWQDLWHNLIE